MPIRNLLATLAFATLAGAAPAAEPPLRVGMELAYPPFEMTDPSGAPAGVSVDLARALADHLGRELRIENIPFTGLIPALKVGKIDLILSSMTATEERARSIAFSEPYLRTGLCLLVAKASPIQSIADADQPGRRIVVKQGTTGQLHAARNLRQAKVLVLDKESACVLEVVQGKADAFIYDAMSVWKQWTQHRDATRPLLKPFQEEAWAIGLRPGDDALRERVNRFLETYRAEGGFERLGDRWLSEQKAAFRELGVPFLF
jgi:polar amino acid transport system substrate-binding protein